MRVRAGAVLTRVRACVRACGALRWSGWLVVAGSRRDRDGIVCGLRGSCVGVATEVRRLSEAKEAG